MKLSKLKTKFFGKNIVYYKEIDSTQKEIWRKIENEDIENGTVIYADIQTNGVGTHGRTWYTDEDNNIAFSLYINANCKIECLEGLTTKIAELIVSIFKENYEISLDIKEPNDIYYNGKKLGGILTETKVVKDIVKHLVIGVGINTNRTSFPECIQDIATSIKKEFGITINTTDFIIEFCNEVEDEILKRM